MTSCHPKGKAGWAQPDLRPDGDLTHGAGVVKLGGTRAVAREEPDFSVGADAQRHQRPCLDCRPDGRRTKKQKRCQMGQSRAEARLSFGSVIAATTAISSSASDTAGQGAKVEEDPKAVNRPLRDDLGMARLDVLDLTRVWGCAVSGNRGSRFNTRHVRGGPACNVET